MARAFNPLGGMAKRLSEKLFHKANKKDGTEAYVLKGDTGKYHGVFRDVDSGETIAIKIWPGDQNGLSRAIAWAKDAVGLVLLSLLVGCAPTLYQDSSKAAFEAGDMTALLVGCGQRAAVGNLFCRFTEGELATGSVVVVVPPVECDAESCATVTIWANDMRVVLERSIPKGQTFVVVPWKTLLGEQPVSAISKGFWAVLVKFAWSDPASGETLQAAAIGEIRVRVLSADYTPLAYDPSSATWRWRVDGVDYVATDKGRAAVKDPVPVVP